MKYSNLICGLLFVICMSCIQNKSDSPPQHKRVDNSIQSELLSKYFSTVEIQGLSNVLAAFEQGICQGLSSDESKRCYDIHFQSLKNDFFQNNPVHLNFPYGNNEMSLNLFKHESIVLSIWNDLCLMGNKEKDIRIEYYCLNPNGPFVDYFKSWSASTGIYKHLIDRIENETLSINQPKELFLVPNEFNFSKIDDRIIYSILHITLAEEYKALQQEK